MEPTPSELEALEPLRRLTRDLKAAAKTLSHAEARYLVDAYYNWQADRIRSAHQVRQLSKGDPPEPHEVLSWLTANTNRLEHNIKAALGAYAGAHVVGKWAQSICGIGPVISAGLLAHIDIQRAPTAGHIWRLAGLDPSVKWSGTEDCLVWIRQQKPTALDFAFVSRAGKYWGREPNSLHHSATFDFKKRTKKPLTELSLAKALARRPWNASLKRLCWLIGESFVKVHKLPDDVYGKLYAMRKASEDAKNQAGDFKEQAADALRAKRWVRETDTKEHYEAGRLPPARLHLRAERYAVKLFLAHFQHVAYYHHFQRHPARPYVITVLEHGHELKVPNWPFAEPQP